MAAVANWRITYTGPSPNTALPSCESTVSSWLGYGWSRLASSAVPKNSVPRIVPIATSVVAAFFDSGRRNAGTPLLIASTPVNATAPDEKPFRIRNNPRVPPASRAPSNASESNGTCPMSPK